MSAPAFWWTPRPTLAALALAPVGAIVGAVTARRMRRPPAARASVPVICVGNPTVGGAGKTPVALAVAAALRDAGAAPVFLLRGYGGRLPGPILVADHDAAAVGDEALLLAAAAPTVVSRDRAAGGRLAARHGDVVVMDDGFQNPALAKDFAVLVIDRAAGLGNGLPVPAGPLRAPLRAHLPLADAVLLVSGDEVARAPLPPLPVPTFDVALAPSGPELAGQRVVAFAGIGRPEKFFATVRRLGADVVAAHPFPDHHPFDEADARRLLATDAILVTTRKDVVRLVGMSGARGELAARLAVVDVAARLPDALRDRVVAVWRGA